MQAGEAVGGDQPPGGAGGGGRAAFGIGDPRHGAGGVLGGAGAVLELLGRGLGGVEKIQIVMGAGRMGVGLGQARIGILRREPCHGHGAGDQLGAGLGGDIGAGDRGLLLADKDPETDVAGLFPPNFLELAQADTDSQSVALGANGFGGVGSGLQGGGDDIG
ncbi:hypothetical protein GALL_538800 [mine drainage metagenome]|uniref:Uncharacterized protein n=1 Tax=mine drainage metagenome TaxID=410659 RepID=A0A1J5NZ80_9ZZZZ